MAPIPVDVLLLFLLQNMTIQTNDTILAQLPSSSGFSIYCTSNLDATGSCSRVDNNQDIACQMVPGGVINCKTPDEPAIQCVIYSGVIGTQAYFYCTRRTDPGVRDNRIRGNRFSQENPAIPQPSQDPSTLVSPLPNDISNPLNTDSGFAAPIKNIFD